jgi:uncharacterized membrane protein YfcA
VLGQHRGRPAGRLADRRHRHRRRAGGAGAEPVAGRAGAAAIAASSLAFALPGAGGAWWLLARRAAEAPRARQHGGQPAGRRRRRPAGAHVTVLAAGRARGPGPGSGLWGLRRAPACRPRPARTPARWAARLAAVGLGSALTGTGGPVLLVPLLLLAGQPLAMTGAAAGAGDPAASGAVRAAGHAWPARSTCGSPWARRRAAGRLAGRPVGRAAPPAAALHRLVCVLLILTGAWFAWRLLA